VGSYPQTLSVSLLQQAQADADTKEVGAEEKEQVLAKQSIA